MDRSGWDAGDRSSCVVSAIGTREDDDDDDDGDDDDDEMMKSDDSCDGMMSCTVILAHLANAVISALAAHEVSFL